jgi:hypothetical protein
MMRSLAVLALLSVATGCGVAPTGASNEAEGPLFTLPPPRCSPGYTFMPFSYEVTTSTTDPWGSFTGIVVTYPTDTTYLVFGWDPATNQIEWYMQNATETDIDNFESYPQSSRWCGSGTNNPNGGSAKGGADPRIVPGICVPPEISSDASLAFVWGPVGGEEVYYCKAWGQGGCVPQSCSALGLGCGSQINNCGRSVYCGACPPPTKCECGGTWPNHCKLCI